LLQLVFAFVNAPLFATFAIGMFWRRATGHGAFFGLLSGTLAAAVHHGLTFPRGAEPGGLKGGYILKLFLSDERIAEAGNLFMYRSSMAQNFWTAIYAFGVCFVVSIVISLFTKPRPDEELKGLVYSLTPRPDEGHLPWHKRPAALAIVVLALTIALNIIFY
jgi:SSS family solute:Na+ symporter